MTLYVDKLESDEKGGFTTDLSKIEYNIKTLGINKDNLLASIGTNPILIANLGKYVFVYKFSPDFKFGTMAFINYQIDLDENFNVFADTLTPKSVQVFHEIQEKIKLKDSHQLNSVELSDNSLLFQKLAQN
jgi:hypothetical protein